MNSVNLTSAAAVPTTASTAKPTDNPALRKAFDEFVGQTFYGQMLKTMRESQGKVAYFGGGQAEEIFSQQLDQVLTKKMTAAGANKLSGPLYDLFTQPRR